MKKILFILLFAVSHCALSDDKFSFGTGSEYSSSTYGGSEKTDILYVPFTVRYASGKLVAKVTVPYISVTGPGNVVRGVGLLNILPSPSTSAPRKTESGLGDVITSLGYNFYSSGSVILDAVGKVKFGTASYARRLGTGVNDYSTQIDGYHPINNTTIYETLGYTWIGSPPGVNLRNIAFGAIGASQRLTAATSVGLVLEAAQSPSAFSPPTRELTAYLTRSISNGLKMQFRVVKGFTDSSPDLGVGLMFIGAY